VERESPGHSIEKRCAHFEKKRGYRDNFEVLMGDVTFEKLGGVENICVEVCVYTKPYTLYTSLYTSYIKFYSASAQCVFKHNNQLLTSTA